MTSHVCPVCESSRLKQQGSIAGFPLLSCERCGHPHLSATADDLASMYGTHYAGFREDTVFKSRIREVTKRALAPLLPKNGRILDVGCGNGEFLTAAVESGFTAVGLDFAQAAADACEKRGLRAFCGDFLTFDFGADAPFDMITLWDVCEHLEKPLDFMRRARGLLAKGGWVILKVPCFTPRAIDISCRIPRLAGGLLGAPSHIQYFRPDTLGTLLSRAGFRVVRTEPLAPMRGKTPPKSLFSSVKRGALVAISRYAGNQNTLAFAQA